VHTNILLNHVVGFALTSISAPTSTHIRKLIFCTRAHALPFRKAGAKKGLQLAEALHRKNGNAEKFAEFFWKQTLFYKSIF